MSSKSHFFDDVRVEHLEVGKGWRTFKAAATSGEAGTRLLDNAAGDLVVTAATNTAQMKIVDDTLFLRGVVKTSGVGSGTGASQVQLQIGRILGTRAVDGPLFMPVGTFFAFAGADSVHGHVYIGSGDRLLRLKGVVKDATNTVDTLVDDLDVVVGAAHNLTFLTSGAELSFQAEIPLKRIEQ